MKRQQPRLRGGGGGGSTSSRAKYSPMEPVLARDRRENDSGSAHPGTSSNTSTTSTSFVADVRPSSKEKFNDYVRIDSTAIEEASSESIPSARASRDSLSSARASYGDSVFSTRDSAWSVGSVWSTRADTMSSINESTPTKNVEVGSSTKGNDFGDNSSKSRSGRDDRKMPSSTEGKGDYRLSIYIAGPEDDLSPDTSSQNEVEVISRDRKQSLPESTSASNGTAPVDRPQSTLVHVSNVDTAPSIKVTGDSRSLNMTLPLADNDNNSVGLRRDLQLGGLSPRPASPSSTTGSLSRRGGENGSSTPRLRISTPKSTSPLAGPGGSGAGAGAQSPNSGASGLQTQEQLDKKVASAEVRSGPSSRRTVVIIAGLFVVGLILILSGIIVLSVEEHTEFRIAGGFFLGCGIVFFIICLVLQKKNVKKLVNELEKDLFFLNVTDNKIWNFIFHFDEQLAWS